MLRLLAETTSAEKVIDVFVNAVGTPAGIVAMGVCCLVVIGALTRPSVKWILISVLLWVCTLAFPRGLETISNQLLPGFQQIRSLNRGIAGLLLITLLFSASGMDPIRRARSFSVAGACFFIFQMLFAARMIGAGDTTRGILAAFIFMLTFAVLGVRLARWLVDWTDADALVWGLAGAGALLALGILPHVIFSRSQVVEGSRLIGTTANPQHLAAHLAVSILPCSYLAFRPRGAKWVRLLLIPVVGLLIGFLLWTGSRTGFLMAAIGLVILFRKNLGRFFIAAVFVLLAVPIFLAFFPDSSMAASRVTETLDTRSVVWRNLVMEFENHPIVGDMLNDFNGAGESSYLATAAMMGIVGLVPLAAFLLSIGITLYKILRRRPKLGEHRFLADLVVAVIVSILVGAVFEAYLLEVLGLEVFTLYACLPITSFLTDATDKATAGVGELAGWDHEVEPFIEPVSPPEFIL